MKAIQKLLLLAGAVGASLLGASMQPVYAEEQMECERNICGLWSGDCGITMWDSGCYETAGSGCMNYNCLPCDHHGDC